MLEPTARVLGMEELLNADAAGRSAMRAKDFIVDILNLSFCSGVVSLVNNATVLRYVGPELE